MDIYGTLGPNCSDEETLIEMFKRGMTGIRLNLSHVTLLEAKEQIWTFHSAAKKCGVEGKLLVDMQGPELRIGKLDKDLLLEEGEKYECIPLPESVLHVLENEMILQMDDGRLKAKVLCVKQHPCGERKPVLQILRGGVLKSGKSVSIEGYCVEGPAVTRQDMENLRYAKSMGVTGIMQPFVRSIEDLIAVKKAMKEAECEDIHLFAKIENEEGVCRLEEFLPYADEIVIARGDLGNAMPLWKLPATQKRIAKVCNEHQKPFMVVTQMLASMTHCKVPTRAEVSDIFNAVLDGAGSVMVTGETAVGDYPVEVIDYLYKTVKEACEFQK